jgi:hypothetical protein
MTATDAEAQITEPNGSKKPRSGVLGVGKLPEAAESLIMDFVGQGEWFYLAQVLSCGGKSAYSAFRQRSRLPRCETAMVSVKLLSLRASQSIQQ